VPSSGDKTKDGTIEAIYGFPEGGGLSIANASSHEELMDTIRDFPLFSFVEWNIKPLVDFNKSLDSATAIFQRMAAQKS